MKTIKELETLLQEFKTIAEDTKKLYPQIKSVDFGDIEAIPLKVMLKFAEKHELKPEYQTWGQIIYLNFYSFNNKFGKFQVSLNSVKVERTIPIAPPVLADSFREIKTVLKK